MESIFKLGNKVRDKITGFEGVVIGITFWMHGCTHISVKPLELKDGKPQDGVAFDEPQLELVKDSRIGLAPEVQPKRGGPAHGSVQTQAVR